jgi:glycosyltransferase involved in cell wall biosynthesis
MTLTVLSVAFPFARLTSDPAGGAEQVLAHLDRALLAAGHRSIVVAAEGSRVAGHLMPVSTGLATLCEPARRQTHDAFRRAIGHVLGTESVDLVHMHGIDFDAYLPAPGVPVLVTLHLPLDWYAPDALKTMRPDTWFNPVSMSQASAAPPGLNLLPSIPNGVAVEAFQSRLAKRKFALALGRVCPEKGFHEAIEASVRADVPLLLAGPVHTWPEHQQYFEEQIAPRLDQQRRWIGTITDKRKRRLLCAARCVLVPSHVNETSSLVAMESLAAGTPVIAFGVGALPDIVEHGVTGYIVRDVGEMAQAIGMVDRLDPAKCRARARRRFALERSTSAYLQLYGAIAARSSSRRQHGKITQWCTSGERY